MNKCKHCQQTISPKAKTCPGCGHPLKKSKGCLLIGCAGLILSMMITAGLKPDERPQPGQRKAQSSAADAPTKRGFDQSNPYNEGDTVDVGYMTYVVWESNWIDELADLPTGALRPAAKYLAVELSAVNNSDKSRNIPPFKLIDSNGKEYATSSDAWLLHNHLGVLDSLNPDVQKDGAIIFDCPDDREYHLKVSGGYWSSQAAYINLKPRKSGGVQLSRIH